ncbi:hypothetical protein ACIPF8_03810 [Collimonas sp. NPDC087041]|uniref:hypothetical protein n=1 Tax=Collimonas sp. NPDC087041 TaxID=3363960 RepID=UPI003818030C
MESLPSRIGERPLPAISCRWIKYSNIENNLLQKILMDSQRLRNLVTELEALTLPEFVDVVNVVAESLSEKITLEMGQGQWRLCLAELYKDAESDWDLGLAARHHAPFDSTTLGTLLFQGTACCGFSIYSCSKQCVCPVCGKKLSAT